MNKQFLSLLLLTSFVGTMSASVPVTGAGIAFAKAVAGLGVEALGGTMSAAIPAHAALAAGQMAMNQTAKSGLFQAFAQGFSGFMGKAGSKFAGLSHTSQYALLTVPVAGAAFATVAGVEAVATTGIAHDVVKSVGHYMGQAQEFAMPVFGTPIRDAANAAEVARLAGRSWSTRAGQAISGYAAVAKTSVSNGVQAVVASAKLHPKSAITAGVVGTVAVGYLAYSLYNKSSISLTEQEMPKLRVALAQAKELSKWPSSNASVTAPVIVKQVFTTSSTGLPKKAVDALNKHLALSCKLSDIKEVFDNNNGRASVDYQRHFAIQQKLKALDAQVLGMFPAVAA